MTTPTNKQIAVQGVPHTDNPPCVSPVLAAFEQNAPASPEANKQIADELERLSGAFEIDFTTRPPRIRVTRDIGSISTLDELFRRAATALREEGGERGELEQFADELGPCPFCGGAPEVWTADDSGDDWYRVECLCGAMVGGSHVYDVAVANWNRRAALREEGGEPDVLSSADERTRVALDLPTNASKARVADSAEWLRAKYDRICGRLQECAQKYGLGLGGEEVDELVVAEVDRLRSQAAVPASDGVSAMQLADSAGDLCANVYVGRRDDALSAGDLCACGIHNEDYVGSLGDCPKCKPVGSKPSESDVDGLAKLMRALAGDEYNSRIDPVTWQQPDYDGAARNFLARLSERRQGVTKALDVLKEAELLETSGLDNTDQLKG